MKSFSLISPLSTAVAVAAVLLAGCDMGPSSDTDADTGTQAAVKSINPYPPGAPTPFFYSAAQWDRYAGKAPPKKPAD